MKTIKIGDKEYILEFTFAAAEHRGLVQKMFNVLSGAYLLRNGKPDENESTVGAMLDGVSDMVSEIPHICITAFYAGLLEHNPMTEEDAKQAMKAYMKENKLSFNMVYDEMKVCMEEDGFFDLSGLKEMLERMNESVRKMAETAEQEEMQNPAKQPQDHKKPRTSTK